MFRAWISTTASSPAANFTRSDSPYVRVDGVIVAINWSDLVDGTLLSAIEVAEDGSHETVIVNGEIAVNPGSSALNNTAFTGTSLDGSSLGGDESNYSGWTQATGTARVGHFYQTSGGEKDNWTAVKTLQGCDVDRRLYCSEQ